MPYFRMLAIDLLLASCAMDEPEMETTPAVPEATGEKIAGGSVLQVFFLRGNQTKGTDIAFFETFWDEPWVAGGFFWEWYVEIDIFNPVFISTENGWYINGKPAETIVRERYSRDPD